MGKLKFHYNPETCQYEQSKRHWSGLVLYGIGLVLMASLFFIGILTVDNQLRTTAEEQALRKKNSVLDKYSKLAHIELSSANFLLEQLIKKETSLSQNIKTPPIGGPNKPLPLSFQLLDSSTPNFFMKAADKMIGQIGFILDQSRDMNTDLVDVSVINTLKNIPSYTPIKNPSIKVLAGYGIRPHPFHGQNHLHKGLDFSVPVGTEVTSTAQGRVKKIHQDDLPAGLGHYIEIDHGGGYLTRYAHLSEIFVRVGQQVKKSMVIAKTGKSGGAAAPHLHYEVELNNQRVNPIYFMLEGVTAKEYHNLYLTSTFKNPSFD